MSINYIANACSNFTQGNKYKQAMLPLQRTAEQMFSFVLLYLDRK